MKNKIPVHKETTNAKNTFHAPACIHNASVNCMVHMPPFEANSVLQRTVLTLPIHITKTKAQTVAITSIREPIGLP